MRCEVCGNDYHKTFQVIVDDTIRIFDSFQCALHALALCCEHCGCAVIGHGVEVEGRVFCCSLDAAEAAAPRHRPAPVQTASDVDRTREVITSAAPHHLQTRRRRARESRR